MKELVIQSRPVFWIMPLIVAFSGLKEMSVNLTDISLHWITTTFSVFLTLYYQYVPKEGHCFIIKRPVLISNNANNFEAGLCGVCLVQINSE